MFMKQLHLHKTVIIFLIVCLSFFNINDVLAVNTHSIDLERSSSQYLSITDGSQTGLDIIGDISLEAWVKFETIPSDIGNVSEGIIGKYASSNISYVLYVNAADKLRLLISNDGSNYDIYQSDAVAVISAETGDWIHYAATYDVSTQTAVLYKNGSPIANTRIVGSGITNIYNGTAPFEIGTFNADSNNCFDGLIDDVRVWNDIRTSTEISDNYNCSLAGTEANLVGYWKLDNGLLDETSNNNDLTNNNSAVFQSASLPFTATCEVGAERRIIITQ